MELLEVKAWPFLVSRNHQIDYRALVVPPSILENMASTILVDAVGESLTQPDNSAIYREIHNLPGGDVTLIFRVIPAEKRFVGLPGSDPLSDQVRRPINIFEGIVVEGLRLHITVTKGDFQVIHEQIEPIYKNFWEKGRREFSTKPSHFFFLSSESATNKRLELLTVAPHVLPAPSVHTPTQVAQELAHVLPAPPVHTPTQEEREKEPAPVLQPTRNTWEKRYRWSRILIEAMLVLLIIIIGVGILFTIFHVIPAFFPTHSPTPTPTHHIR